MLDLFICRNFIGVANEIAGVMIIRREQVAVKPFSHLKGSLFRLTILAVGL